MATTVVTELFDTVYCVRLKQPQRFESRNFLRLQVEREESGESALFSPLDTASLKGEEKIASFC